MERMNLFNEDETRDTTLLNEVTLRIKNNSAGAKKISETWNAIIEGTLPLSFNVVSGAKDLRQLVSIYSNYENNKDGEYDLTISKCDDKLINELENRVLDGSMKKYKLNLINGSIEHTTKKAWKLVWDDEDTGKICREYIKDYEFFINTGKEAYVVLYIGCSFNNKINAIN